MNEDCSYVPGSCTPPATTGTTSTTSTTVQVDRPLPDTGGDVFSPILLALALIFVGVFARGMATRRFQ